MWRWLPQGSNESVPRQKGKPKSNICYQHTLNITKRCETELSVRVFVCETCECKHSQTGQNSLVLMKMDHKLLTNSTECHPWFVQADTGIRTFIAKKRDTLLRAEAERCGL